MFPLIQSCTHTPAHTCPHSQACKRVSHVCTEGSVACCCYCCHTAMPCTCSQRKQPDLPEPRSTTRAGLPCGCPAPAHSSPMHHLLHAQPSGPSLGMGGERSVGLDDQGWGGWPLLASCGKPPNVMHLPHHQCISDCRPSMCPSAASRRRRAYRAPHKGRGCRGWGAGGGSQQEWNEQWTE